MHTHGTMQRSQPTNIVTSKCAWDPGNDSLLRVAAEYVGWVLGTNGSVVNRIADDTGTKLFLNDNECHPHQYHHHRHREHRWRTFTVSGKPAAKAEAFARVRYIVDHGLAAYHNAYHRHHHHHHNNNNNNNSNTASAAERVQVPMHLVGQVVGTEGSVLQRIWSTTGATVALDQAELLLHQQQKEQHPLQWRTFDVSGSPAAVEAALDHVRFIVLHGALEYMTVYSHHHHHYHRQHHSGAGGKEGCRSSPELLERAKQRQRAEAATAAAAGPATTTAWPCVKNDPSVTRVEELLKAGGWVFLRTGKHKGHRRDIGFGRTQNVSVALTPSDVRSFQNLRSRLKRLDEERDAWQQEKRAEGEKALLQQQEEEEEKKKKKAEREREEEEEEEEEEKKKKKKKAGRAERRKQKQWQKQSKAQRGKTEKKPPLLAVRNARHGLPLGA
jgi:chemotaxis protein histidine kinase CheA